MTDRTVTCLDCGTSWTESVSKHGSPAKRCTLCAQKRKRERERIAQRERRAAKAAGRWKSTRTPPNGHIISDTELRCSKCREVKHVDDFHRASKEKSGRQPYCKPCMSAYRRENGHKHAERASIRHRLKKYGLTTAQFNAMLEEQGMRCAICRTDDPTGRWGSWAVDHCHATGNVRGILCYPCNTALGLIRDNPAVALALADYLLERQSDPVALRAMQPPTE